MVVFKNLYLFFLVTPYVASLWLKDKRKEFGRIPFHIFQGA